MYVDLTWNDRTSSGGNDCTTTDKIDVSVTKDKNFIHYFHNVLC